MKRFFRIFAGKSSRKPLQEPSGEREAERSEKQPQQMKYLIAGLGNIGAEYKQTRHNAGFRVVEKWAADSGAEFESNRYGSTAEVRFKGRTFVLLKPSTYMNLSGKAVKYWMDKENVPVANLLVVVDDIALPFGTIRMRLKGSDGGHNGLKDIDRVLGGNNYARLRFGIGGDFPKGFQIDYVLGEWTADEQKELPFLLDEAAEAIKAFGTVGPERAMNTFNTRKNNER